MASGGFSLRGRDSLASTTFYKNYVERHSFAFKNAGIYYIESYPSTRRFYGVALDLSQAESRLPTLCLDNQAPARLQKLFYATRDERDFRFKVVKRISPFERKVVVVPATKSNTGSKGRNNTTSRPAPSRKMVRAAMPFAKFKRKLFNLLSGLILQHNVHALMKAKIMPLGWKTWRAFVRHENQVRHFAAIKIQSRYRIRNGQLLAHMKRFAMAEEAKAKRQMDMAARRIQSAWRRKQGQFAAHLKRQARAEAKLEVVREKAAACQIHVWWSRISGSFARKMKERAGAQLRLEEEMMKCAALNIQHWWSMLSGTYVAKMKARAKLQLVKEEREREDAAHRLQIWWSRMSGSYAAKLKARAKMQMFKEEQAQTGAVLRIQHWWSMLSGTYVAKMKARAKLQLRREEQEAEAAALKIQVAWRRRQGQLGAHLKRQAKKHTDAHDAALLSAALYCQLLYRRSRGKLAYHIASRARSIRDKEMAEQQRAAVYIQFVWRKAHGQLAVHLIKQARKRVTRRRKKRRTELLRFPNTEVRATAWSDLLFRESASMNSVMPSSNSAPENWEVAWSDEYHCEYWYNLHTGISSWERPF
jgi:hypothetical protein